MRDEEVGRGARRCARERSEVYAVVAEPSTAGKMARHSMVQDMRDSDDDDDDEKMERTSELYKLVRGW